MKKMKQRVKAKARKLVVSILVAAMTFALIPKFIGHGVVLASGTKNGENTCLGTSKMASPATPTASSEWSGSKVYFGTYGDEPILFRVLAPNTSAYGGSTLFLDSDKTLFKAYFDNTSPYSNSWANSDIRANLNDSFLNGFTELEKAAIATSRGNGGCSYAADSWQEYVYGSPVSVNDKVFLLDAAEITNEAYGYSSDTGFTLNSGTWSDSDYSWHTVSNHIKGGSSDYWWLRSANSSFDYYAGTVFYIGSLSDNDVRVARVGVAPALNINQSSIIFSSLISGSFNTVGAEYKLTIKDPDLDIAVPAGQQVAVSGTTVTVPYEIGGANSGTATRSSILITDKKWDASDATIKLYDALGTNKDTSGTFTLPSDLDFSGWGTDYHVYILAEDINDGHDGKDTDYASAPVELALPIAAPTITTQPSDLSLTYGYSSASLSIAAGEIAGHTLSYKWYSCDDTNRTNPVQVGEGSSYTIPTGKNAGTTEYYYCVVTATRGTSSAETASRVATVTVGKGTMTLTATGFNGQFNAQPHTVSAAPSVTDGTTVQYSTDGEKWSTSAPTRTDICNLTVYVKAVNSNYNDATATAELVITRAPATVTANSAGKVFGAEDPEFSATVSGIFANEDFTLEYTVTRPGKGRNEDAGTYPDAIVPDGEKEQGNYTVTYVAATFTITKADTMTVTAMNYEDEYDGKEHKGGGEAKVGENILGDAVFSYFLDGENWSDTVPSITDVGTVNYFVKASHKNYKDVTAEGVLTVKTAGAPALTDANKPTANDLTENEVDQALVTAPETVPDGYTVEYSTDGQNWSADIPTGKDSGEYTVYFRYTGDNNHESFDGGTLSVKIKAVYTVIWLDAEGNKLDEKTYVEGENVPTTDKKPTKAEDADNTYTFDKWDGGTVDGKTTTYRPTFTTTKKENPATGDGDAIFIWLAFTAVSGAVLAIAYRKKRTAVR